MHHHHRPRRRYPIQLAHRQPRRAEVDGIETPRQQRRAGVLQLAGGIGKARDDFLQRAQPAPEPAIGIAAVEVADVDRVPHRAFHQVAVAFDHAGHQDLVAEGVDHHRVGPWRHLRRAADRKDLAVAYRDMGRFRLRRFHREDLARDEYLRARRVVMGHRWLHEL
ncbi:hypothetical protein D3C72_1427800 [compost metagenome]